MKHPTDIFELLKICCNDSHSGPGYYLYSPHEGSVFMAEVFMSRTGCVINGKPKEELIIIGGGYAGPITQLPEGGKWSKPAKFDY